MKGRLRMIVMACVVGALAASPEAAEQGKKKAVKTGVVTGVVVDIACEVLGEAPGPGHRACAEGGVPMGIVDARGKLWHAINASYGSATPLLLPLIGQCVRAEGWFVERKGERLISIAKVEAVAAAAAERWVCPHACGGTGTHAGACPKCGLAMVKAGK